MRMLWLKTWRDTLARKGQFGALVLLVMLGITSYVAFVTGYLDLSHSLDVANERLRYADFTTKVAEAPAGVVDRIRRLPGVAAAEGRLVIDTGVDMPADEKATARVTGIPSATRPAINDLVVLQGRYLRSGARDEVLLHPKFAAETGMKVGDTLQLRVDGHPTPVKVVGIATAPNHMYPLRAKGELPSPREFAVVYMDAHETERLFRRGAVITDVLVRLTPGADEDRVIAEVEHVMDPYTVIDSVTQADEPSNFGLNEEIDQNRLMAESMPILILSISSLSLFIALSRIVTSQRGEIGLAKALGYSDWQILLHYILFALLIAVVGSVLGIVLGLICARGIAAMYVSMLGIPFLESRVYPQVVLASLGMSIVACVLAGIVPAWASARIAPAEAMRTDPNLAVKGGRIPLVERLFGWAMPKSFTFRIPLRNVFRARRRSIYTIIGVAFAMVLTIATVSMFDSIDYLIGRVFTASERWDVLATFDERFGGDRVDEVARWKGVTRVQPALIVPVKIVATGGKEHSGAITATVPGATFHGFDIAEGPQPRDALESGGLVMATSVASKLGVKAGDAVTLDSPYVNEDIVVRVASTSRETLGGSVFASADVGRQLLGESRPTYNALYVNVDPAYARRVRTELFDLPGAEQVQIKASVVEKLFQLMSFLRAFGAVLLAFGYAMAFAVIYNTFTANVLERTREIATMRTIGESSSRIAVMVTIENLLLAIVGVPLGIWLGLEAANAIYAQFSTESYTFEAIVFPSSVAIVSASIVAVMLLSELPPIRRIFRLDLAEATKVME